MAIMVWKVKIIIACCLIFYLFATNNYLKNDFLYSLQNSSKILLIDDNQQNNVSRATNYANLPIILAYTKIWNDSIFNKIAIKSLQNCYFKCQWSEEKILYPIADAVIFHAPNFHLDEILISELNKSTNNNNSNRLNIYYTGESRANWIIPERHLPKDFFNITMTFRKDSTIFKPYDRFIEIEEKEKNNAELVWTENQITEILKQKKNLALKIVSNCVTHSRREDYINVLKKYANLTLLGSCYNKSLAIEPYIIGGAMETVGKKIEALIKNHYFYLSFENSVCKDYVSEKFWRFKKLIVPVVLKRSILKGIVDDEYFIAADDFGSPKELAEKLIYLSKNHTEYRKYLDWTKKYKKTSGFDEREMCRICQMITKKEKHTIPNIYFWERHGDCEWLYGQTLVKKSG